MFVLPVLVNKRCVVVCLSICLTIYSYINFNHITRKKTSNSHDTVRNLLSHDQMSAASLIGRIAACHVTYIIIE